MLSFYVYLMAFTKTLSNSEENVLANHERTNEDYKFIKKIGRSTTEPVFYRSLALIMAASLRASRFDAEGQTLQYYDDAMSAVGSMD